MATTEKDESFKNKNFIHLLADFATPLAAVTVLFIFVNLFMESVVFSAVIIGMATLTAVSYGVRAGRDDGDSHIPLVFWLFIVLIQVATLALM